MNDPLINLKKSMKNTMFKEFSFSDERKRKVKKKIKRNHSLPQMDTWHADTVTTVLASIEHEAKQGYDISTHLIHKRNFSLQNQEGQLYALLHVLENKQIIISTWLGEKKYYTLAKKGKKVLAKHRQDCEADAFSLKRLIEEASL